MGFALSEMRLSSSAFEPGGAIPAKYTGRDENVSPPLEWSDAPAGTKSLAIICHDPDAPLVTPDGTFGLAHWVLYNVPAAVTGIPEDARDLYTTGPNQMGKDEYVGPGPPPGHGPHHYFFWLLALDLEPTIESGLSMWQLLKRIEPNVLGMNRLVGTYVNTAS